MPFPRARKRGERPEEAATEVVAETISAECQSLQRATLLQLQPQEFEVAQPAADAVSAASGWGEAAADATGEAVKQFAPPLLDEPLGIYVWINDNIVALFPYLFQIIIVLAEVGIGLMLIGGLLTAPAAVVSLGLSIMFLIGAMAGKEILWFMIVSIVMIGGAGRAFGLDYWVMPWIKKIWNKIPIVEKPLPLHG